MALVLRPLALPVEGVLQEAMSRFDCCGETRADDQVAQEVNAFLHDGGYALGVEQDLSSTYLFIDDDYAPPEIVGYTTLALDSVRLTDSEKKRLDRPNFADLGAIRIVMIGVDWRRQGRGVGTELLRVIVGLSKQVGRLVAVRFLVADVNLNERAWYEGRLFEMNRCQAEQAADPNVVSMRLDLRLHA